MFPTFRAKTKGLKTTRKPINENKEKSSDKPTESNKRNNTESQSKTPNQNQLEAVKNKSKVQDIYIKHVINVSSSQAVWIVET